MNVEVVRPRWVESPFVTEVVNRPDGSLLLCPRAELGLYPLRTMDALEHWAAITPERVLVARRASWWGKRRHSD